MKGRVALSRTLILAALAAGCGGKTIQVEVPAARAWPVDGGRGGRHPSGAARPQPLPRHPAAADICRSPPAQCWPACPVPATGADPP